MQQLKRDILQNAHDNVVDLLTDGDRIIEEFSVAPYDYSVEDWATPTLFLTRKRLVFSYDESLEVYMLADLELDLYGDPPKFTPWQQWLEGTFYYSREQRESLRTLKIADFYTHLVITEPKQIPREFAYRKGIVLGNTSQSWAMAQMILNQKHGVAPDERLKEMLTGGFTKFNGSTVITFTLMFIGYFILSYFLKDLDEIVGTVLDVIFGVLVVLMGAWTYKSIEKNLGAYEAVYNSYQHSTPSIEKRTSEPNRGA